MKIFIQGFTPRPAPPCPTEKQAAPPRNIDEIRGVKLTADSIDTPFHYARK